MLDERKKKEIHNIFPGLKENAGFKTLPMFRSKE